MLGLIVDLFAGGGGASIGLMWVRGAAEWEIAKAVNE